MWIVKGNLFLLSSFLRQPKSLRKCGTHQSRRKGKKCRGWCDGAHLSTFPPWIKSDSCYTYAGYSFPGGARRPLLLFHLTKTRYVADMYYERELDWRENAWAKVENKTSVHSRTNVLNALSDLTFSLSSVLATFYELLKSIFSMSYPVYYHSSVRTPLNCEIRQESLGSKPPISGKDVSQFGMAGLFGHCRLLFTHINSGHCCKNLNLLVSDNWRYIYRSLLGELRRRETPSKDTSCLRGAWDFWPYLYKAFSTLHPVVMLEGWHFFVCQQCRLWTFHRTCRFCSSFRHCGGSIWTHSNEEIETN